MKIPCGLVNICKAVELEYKAQMFKKKNISIPSTLCGFFSLFIR